MLVEPGQTWCVQRLAAFYARSKRKDQVVINKTECDRDDQECAQAPISSQQDQTVNNPRLSKV
jgi:hypothetical protein